jgi:HPt (histidine-containing phosphotransfer) domain-containing protein
MCKILINFVREAATSVSGEQEAVASESREDLTQSAHGLKGDLCCNVGRKILSELAFAMKQQGGQNTFLKPSVSNYLPSSRN